MVEVYKSCKTSVFDTGDKYRIENTDGHFAIVDKDERILNALIEALGGKRSLQYNDICNYFYINIGNRFVCNLRQLVVAAVMNGDFYDNLQNVKNGQVKLKNRDEPNNFCFENLEYSKMPGDSSVNTFWDDGKFFYIKHNASGVIVKTDICESLNDLIKSKRWYYIDHYKMMVTTKEANRFEFMPIYRYIAFYRYYRGNMEYERWYETYSKLLDKLDACVDHIDNDLTNCTLRNLEIIKRSENVEKGSLVLKCNKSPFKCRVYFEDDVIFMEAGYEDGEVEINSKSQFYKADDFVRALKYFYNNGVAVDESGRKIVFPKTPRERWKDEN